MSARHGDLHPSATKALTSSQNPLTASVVLYKKDESPNLSWEGSEARASTNMLERERRETSTEMWLPDMRTNVSSNTVRNIRETLTSGRGEMHRLAPRRSPLTLRDAPAAIALARRQQCQEDTPKQLLKLCCREAAIKPLHRAQIQRALRSRTVRQSHAA